MPAEPLIHHELSDRLGRDGYAVVEGLLNRQDIDYLLERFRALDCSTHHGAWNASMLSSDVAYREAVDRAIKEVVTPRAATLVPGYRLCFCNFLVKDPQQDDIGAVQIHQDPTFVDEERYETLGIWIPLVDTDHVNGAIAVLPGSHRWNHGPRGFGGVPSPYLHLMPSFVEHAQTLPMKAGTALVFSQKLFHGSPPNRGRAKRVSAAVLLAPIDAPLRCCYANPAIPGKLELFAVEDDFYLRYPYGTRPEGVERIAVVDRTYDAVDLSQVRASAKALAASSR